jgi:hypothetical protein
MSGFGESIGAAIEGGLISRAVEPTHGEAGKAAPAPAECANCGAMVSGHYCAQCGQKAHVHRSLGAIMHDIIHGVLHLDGKLWHTLPLLTFKPGVLTHRYIAGERAKFVSPMAMFLFSVFAMFAVFQMVGISAPTDLPTDIMAPDNDNPFQSKLRQQVTTLEKERSSLSAADPRRDQIDKELTVLDTMLDSGASEIKGGDTIEEGPTGIGWLDKSIIGKWKKNPSLMLYKLQANGYKFSWLLIPLSVPFVWLMFAWRRKFHGYDHAVFVTYSLAFMSLLFIAMSLISVIPGGAGWAAMLFFIGAPLHLYKQLRHAYGLSRFSTVWRFCMLLVSSQIVLTLFLLILGVLGAF